MADHILGPYREARGPADAAAPGGARVLPVVAGHVLGPDGRTEYLVYHAWNAAMTERQLCVDPLAWTAQGPRCLGPTYTPQPLPR